MNRTFKTIFNRTRNTMMAVNEATHSLQKRGTKCAVTLGTISALLYGVGALASTEVNLVDLDGNAYTGTGWSEKSLGGVTATYINPTNEVLNESAVSDYEYSRDSIKYSSVTFSNWQIDSNNLQKLLKAEEAKTTYFANHSAVTPLINLEGNYVKEGLVKVGTINARTYAVTPEISGAPESYLPQKFYTVKSPNSVDGARLEEVSDTTDTKNTVRLVGAQVGSVLLEQCQKFSGERTVLTGGNVTIGYGAKLTLNNQLTAYGYDAYDAQGAHAGDLSEQYFDYNASLINTLSVNGGTFISEGGTVAVTSLVASSSTSEGLSNRATIRIDSAQGYGKTGETLSTLGNIDLTNSTLEAGNVAVGSESSHATVTVESGSSTNLKIGGNSYIGTLTINGNSSFKATLDTTEITTGLRNVWDSGFQYHLDPIRSNLGSTSKTLSIDTISTDATETKETDSTASIQLGVATLDTTTTATLNTTLHDVTLEKNRYLLAKNTIVADKSASAKSTITVNAGATFDADNGGVESSIGTLTVKTDTTSTSTSAGSFSVTGGGAVNIDAILTEAGSEDSHATISINENNSAAQTSRIGDVTLNDFATLSVSKAAFGKETSTDGNVTGKVNITLHSGAQLSINNLANQPAIETLEIKVNDKKNKKGELNLPSSAVFTSIDKIITGNGSEDNGKEHVDLNVSVETLGSLNLGEHTKLTANAKTVSTTENVEIQLGSGVNLTLAAKGAASSIVTGSSISTPKLELKNDSAEFSANYFESVSLGEVSTTTTEGATGGKITISNANSLSATSITLDGNSSFVASEGIKSVRIGALNLNATSTATVGKAGDASTSDSSTIDNITIENGATFNVAEGEIVVETINKGATTPTGTVHVGTVSDTTTGTTAKSATLKVTDTTNVLNIGTLTVEEKSTFDATGVAGKISKITTANGAKGSGKHAVMKMGSDSGSYSEIGELNLGEYSEISLTRTKINSSDVSTLDTGVKLTLTGDKTDDAVINFADGLTLNKGASFSAENYKTVSLGDVSTATTEGATGGKITISNTNSLSATSISLDNKSSFTVKNATAEVKEITGSGTFQLEGTNATLDGSGGISTLGVLNLDASSKFIAKDVTLEVGEIKGAGSVSVGTNTAATSGCTSANMYVKTLSMNGGSIYVDPAYGKTSVLTIESLGTSGSLNTNITAGPGALVTIGMGSARAAKAAVESNIENKASRNANAESTGCDIGSSSSLIYVAKAMTLGETGSLTADPNATAATGDAKTVNAKNGGVIVIDQQKVGAETVVFSGATSITVDSASSEGATSALAIINIDGSAQKVQLTDVANPTVSGNNFPVYTDNPFVTATLEKDTGIIWLKRQATEAGLTVLATTGAQAMANRIDTVLSKTVSDRFALPHDIAKGKNLWAYVSGERFEEDHIGAGASFAANMGYGAFGLDLYPTENSLLGVGFQYSRGTLKADSYSVKNKIKAYSGALYAGYTFEATGIELLGELAYTQGKNDVTNSYYEGLNQKFDTKTYSAGLTVQKKFDVGAFDITPSVGVRVSKIKTDSMNAGSIEIGKQSQTLVAVPVAIRFTAKPIETESGWLASPKFKLSVTPTFGDKKIEVFSSKCTVIDTNPVQGSFGIGFTKGNFSTDIEANFGSGRLGTTFIGGKIGVNYRF